MPPKPLQFTIALLLLLSIVSCQELTNFTYANHGTDWPSTFCRAGNQFLIVGDYQSPVELKRNVRGIDSFLFTDFREAEADINFYNTTIYMKSPSLGTTYFLNMSGKAFTMNAQQVRVRCQAQHVITDDGAEPLRHDLELQIFHMMVYQSENERLALSLFFKEGTTADPNLDKIIQAYQQNATKVKLDFSKYLRLNNNLNFWQYRGSPTMPRCNDNYIHWVLIDKAFEMSPEQNQFFHAMFYGKTDTPTGNYRGLQKNKNEVGYYSSSQQQ